jgi:hypothetical protein
MMCGIYAGRGGGAVARMLLEEESSSSKENTVWTAPAVAAIGISKASEDGGGVGSLLSDLSSSLLRNGSEMRRRR